MISCNLHKRNHTAWLVCNLSAAAIVLSVLTLLCPVLVSADVLPALFTQVGTVSAMQTYPLSAERITVSVDFSLLYPDNNQVTAMTAAIPGRIITLTRDRLEKRTGSNYAWFGRVEGSSTSTVVLTVVDGAAYGTINMDGETYSVTPNTDGYTVIKNDPSKIPPYNDDVIFPPARPDENQVQPFGIVPLADDGSVIDVLVLYTQQFQTKYGTSLTAKIQSFIDLANQAYINSGIGTSLRLAYSVLYTAAGAAEGIAIDSALPYIRADAGIGTLRDTYHADLVSLLRVYQDTSACGLGYIFTPPLTTSFAPYGFNVVEVRSLSECTGSCYYCSDTTFAHELGHNMGCAHDRAHASGQGAYPYSYGYDYVAAGIASPQFATIMSYENPEIYYFSTPSPPVPWTVPIGVTGGASGTDNPTTSADNARTINNTRLTVANFRTGSDTTPPPAPIGLSSTPSSWTNSNSFSINWTNPSDPSGIAGAYYKIGSAPGSDSDGVYTTSKPFVISATAQGGQGVYVWLRDGAGNRNYLNNASTTLYYDGTAPSDGSLSATPGAGQVSLSWSGFSDSGGSGLRGTNTYKAVRSTGSYPAAQCAGGTQVYLGSGTAVTDTGLSNGQTYYYRVCSYDNAGSISTGATAQATVPVQITIATSPSGRPVTVDSVSYTAPHIFTWTPGAGHAVSLSSPQSGGTGIQYLFTSWSDSGARDHTITTPSADATYIANFTLQYTLTTAASPGTAGSIGPDCSSGCWYNSGSAASLSADPAPGYVFTSWSGACAGGNSVTSVPMNGVKACTANFSSCLDSPARNERTSAPFTSVSAAYGSAETPDTIQIIGTTVPDISLDLNRGISVTLSGGYGCGYTGPASYTIIQGPMTINKNSLAVTVENLILQ